MPGTKAWRYDRSQQISLPFLEPSTWRKADTAHTNLDPSNSQAQQSFLSAFFFTQFLFWGHILSVWWLHLRHFLQGCWIRAESLTASSPLHWRHPYDSPGPLLVSHGSGPGSSLPGALCLWALSAHLPPPSPAARAYCSQEHSPKPRIDLCLPSFNSYSDYLVVFVYISHIK